MPEGDLGPSFCPDVQGDPEVVLRDEVADALLQVSQDRKRWGLHAAKAPRLPESRWPQPQGNGAGAVETEVVVLILAAQGFKISGIVPLTGVGLLSHRRKGAPDRDLVESAQLETVHPTSIAKMLKHLPGDHRAFPARIGGDDDP